MKTRALGKDLEVSALGFGCMGLRQSYGRPVPREEGVRFGLSGAIRALSQERMVKR